MAVPVELDPPVGVEPKGALRSLKFARGFAQSPFDAFEAVAGEDRLPAGGFPRESGNVGFLVASDSLLPATAQTATEINMPAHTNRVGHLPKHEVKMMRNRLSTRFALLFIGAIKEPGAGGVPLASEANGLCQGR
ncbi:MAG: hypothetical protein DME18_15060 [Verrucomicrobia bacterium]|nr:MAG: hypothetical protein DME18_15060 [Verrucomicrobiota bacterium]